MARTVQLFKYQVPLRQLMAAVAGGSVLLVLLAALLAPAFIDWNRFRAPLAELVSDSIGRQVGITGDMSFQPFPVPTLQASELRIANLPEGQATYFAEIQRLDMKVALWPLLNGRLQLRQVELVAPVVHLESLPDGRGNWDGLVPADADGTRRAIGIDALRISEGRLDYRRPDTGQVVSLAAVTGRLKAETLPGPVEIALTGRIAGRSFAIDLTLAQALQDGRLPLVATASLGDLEGDFRGLVTLSQDDAEAAGKLTLQTPALADALRDLAVITGRPPPPESLLGLADMPLAMAGDLAGAQAAKIRLKLSQASLGATALSGQMTLTPGDPWTFEAALSGDRVDLDRLLGRVDDPQALERALLSLDGPVGLQGALDLDISALSLGDGVISRLSLRMESDSGHLRLPRLSAEGPGASRLSGALARLNDGSGVTGEIKLTAGDLRRALRWLSVAPDLPDTVLLQGMLESSFALRPRSYTLSGTRLRLDGMAMTGSFAVDMGGVRPAVSARLRTSRIDADSYLPPGRAAPDLINAGLAALARIDGDMELAVDRLDIAGRSVRGVVIDAASDADGLDIRAARLGDLQGTAVNLSGRLRAGDVAPAGRLALSLRSPDIAPLLHDLDIRLPPPLKQLGPGEIAADLTVENDALAGSADALFAGGRLTIDGRIAGWPWAAGRDFALTGHLAHPDHRGLARRLGLDWLDRGASGPVLIDTALSGDLDRIAGALDLALLGGRLTLSGALADPLARPHPDGALQTKFSHPDGLWLARALDLPRARAGGPALPLTFDARISGAPDIWRLESVSLAAGPDEITGAGRLDLTGARPAAALDLATQDLSLDRLLMPPETAFRHGDWPRRALPTGWLAALDGSLKLRADRLSYAGYALEALALSATLADGALNVPAFTATVLDAPLTLDAQIAQVASGLRLAIDLDWRNTPLHRVSSLLLGVAPLSGAGHIAADLQTAGASLNDLVAALSGRLSVGGADLALEGVNLGALARRIAEANDPRDLALLDLAGWRNGATPLADVTLETALSDGILSFTGADLSGAAGDIAGDLTADLARWRVTGAGQASLAAHPGLPPLGVRLAGPLSDPRLTLDLRAIRAALADRLSKPPIPALSYDGPPPEARYGAPATVGEATDGDG